MTFGVSIYSLILQAGLGFLSIVLAELVRDFYHVAGHYWSPLQVPHSLHHKAYRRDLSMTSLAAYKKAQLYNDVPEAAVMATVTGAIALLSQTPVLGLGCIYSLGFLLTSLARSRGLLLQTDLTHKPGPLVEAPSQWTVNRTYHWRHHFDQGNAYYCGYFTVVDKMLGTALSLRGKVVAVTGASGAMGRSLIDQLTQQGAKVVALTTSPHVTFDRPVEVIRWHTGAEAELLDRLNGVDILILNHGVNVYGDRTAEAIQTAFEVNTFSAWRLAELFLSTVQESADHATKELWINTSEAEVNPALSPLYELSKRMLGDLITLRRLDSPCIIRKIVLGPFKSSLNPYGVMSPRWVAWAVVALAKRDVRNIIVTINPLTYLIFLPKEWARSLYFRLFTRAAKRSVSELTSPTRETLSN
jgi:monoglucosyldiacylglycerol epimerase